MTHQTEDHTSGHYGNLHPVPAASAEVLRPAGVDRPAAERAAAALLEALGADLRDESLRETPRRIASLYGELLSPAPFDATTFPMCMSLRGVQKQGATTVTSALHGLVRDDPRTRQALLALTGRTGHA